MCPGRCQRIMSTIKIFTLDQNTVIQADAVKDDGTSYAAEDITLIRILISGPRNDTDLYAAVTASFTAAPTFQGTITGTLPKAGYWGIQFEYTLASSAKPVHTKIFHEYVGSTIVPSA